MHILTQVLPQQIKISNFNYLFMYNKLNYVANEIIIKVMSTIL